MDFDPDSYLKGGGFNPDQYLGNFNPDEYLGSTGMLDKIKQNFQKNSPVVGGIEAAANLATQLPAMAAGGIAGLGGLLNPKQDISQNPTRDITQELTYEPGSEYGKNIVEGLGTAFGKLEEIGSGRHLPERKQTIKPNEFGINPDVKTEADRSKDEMLSNMAFETATSLSPSLVGFKGKPKPIATDPMAAKIEAAAKKKAEPVQSESTPNDLDQMAKVREAVTAQQHAIDLQRQAQGIPQGGESIRMTPEGQRVPPEQYGQHNQGLEVSPPQSRIPTLPEAGEQPLPGLNTIDENYVPPVPPIKKTKTKETPLPKISTLELDMTELKEELAKQNNVVAQQAEHSQLLMEANRKFDNLDDAMKWYKEVREFRKAHTDQLAADLDRMGDLQQQLDKMEPSQKAIFLDKTRSIRKHVGEDGTINHINVLFDIWKSSEDGLLKRMAKHLLENQQILEGYKAIALMDINGEILPRLKDEKGTTYIGEYFGSTHATYLSAAGLTERAFMHELMHGATVRSYLSNPTLRRTVDSIFSELNKRLKIEAREVDGTQIKTVAKNTGKWEYHYGLETPLEMLAEVFTNNHFRNFLRNTAPYRNLWTKIADTLKGLFGIKSSELNNFLNRIDKVGQELMEFHNSKKLSNEQIYREMKQDDFKPSTQMKWDSPLAEGDKQQKVLEDIPGLRELTKNMIPDYRPVEEVLKQVAQEPDVSKGSALIGGGIQHAEMKKSSAIYAAYDWLSTATKKAAYADRTNIAPAEQVVNKLYNKDRKSFRQLFNILTNESTEKVRFSPEELIELGVSEDVIGAHEAFRDMMDDVYTKQASSGEKIDYREGFFSSRWQGPWGMAVYKASNPDRPVWYIQAGTRSQALKAKAYLEKNVEGLAQIKEPKYRESPLADKVNNVEAGYNTLKDFLGEDDPATVALKDAWERYQEAEGKKALDQRKHFDTNTGVRGYAGDRPWMNSDKDMLEGMKEQFQYARNGYRWTELQTAVGLIKEMNKALEEKPNTLKQVRDYTKNHLGVGSDRIVRAIESRVGEQWSKYAPFTGNELTEMIRSLFYIKTLGVFNVPFSVTSMVQPIFTGPEHFNLQFHGYKHNPIVSIADSMHDGMAILWNNINELAPNSDIAKGLTNKIKDALKDPFTREMSEYARQNGIVTINQFSDIRNLGKPKMQMLERVGGFNLIATEAASRAIAFAGFVSHLKQSGKFDSNLAIFKKAEELTNLTMVDYRHFERANLFNKAGLAGRALSTLQTFHINQWNNVWRYAKEAKSGNIMPLAAMLGTQFTFAGMTGMFGIEAINDAWESLKPVLPTRMQEYGVKKFLVEHLKDWSAYGPVSMVTGLNWSTRFDAGNIVDPTIEGLLPFVSDAYKTGKAAYKLAKDRDEGRLKEFGYQVAPASVKGAVDATQFKRAEKDNGNTLYAPTSDFAMGKPFERTPKDVNARMMGMRTNSESAQKDILYRSRIAEEEMKDRRNRYSDNFKRAIVQGRKDEAKEAAQDFVEAEGDVKELTQWIQKSMVKSRYLTEAQQIVIRAGSSVTAAKRAQRMKQGMEHARENYK